MRYRPRMRDLLSETSRLLLQYPTILAPSNPRHVNPRSFDTAVAIICLGRHVRELLTDDLARTANVHYRAPSLYFVRGQAIA